jgi:predicted transcriptional regulator
MSTSRNVIMPAMAGILAVSLYVGALPVYAQTPGNRFEGLVEAIASKFGLNQTQVQTFMDQFFAQKKQTVQQTMQNREKTRLDGLVSLGKITAAQETAIIDKLTQVRTDASKQDFRNMTPQQRQDAMQKRRDDLTAWAKSQGIDPTVLTPGNGMMGRGGGMGRRGGWWRGNGTTPAPTPAQ